MARQRPADHLTASVLARPEFVGACGSRDLGEVLRLAKQWGGVGFTASHLARRCELTVSRVQDYIVGRIQAQRVEVFERVADGLRIPGGMFNLAPRPWETSAPATTASDNAEIGDSSVLRRDFVKLGAGLATSVAAGKIVGVPSRSTGNRVGDSTLAQLRADTVRLRRLDDHLGGAETFQLYIAEVAKTASILKSNSCSLVTKRALLELLAEQSQQAGWAAFDAGWGVKAERLYQSSYSAAQTAGNDALAANALALDAYRRVSSGESGEAASTRSSKMAASANHPAVRSLLYQRAAWTYAIAGDAQRTGRVLGLAEEALAERDPGTVAPDWAAWAHTTTELEIMAGRCWTELRRPLRAVPVLESAMAKYDDSHARDKALYLSWLAHAYLDAGEVERTAQVVEQALDLSAGVASPRPGQRLDTVVARLSDHAAVDGVADLLARRPLDPGQVGR